MSWYYTKHCKNTNGYWWPTTYTPSITIHYRASYTTSLLDSPSNYRNRKTSDRNIIDLQQVSIKMYWNCTKDRRDTINFRWLTTDKPSLTEYAVPESSWLVLRTVGTGWLVTAILLIREKWAMKSGATVWITSGFRLQVDDYGSIANDFATEHYQ